MNLATTSITKNMNLLYQYKEYIQYMKDSTDVIVLAIVAFIFGSYIIIDKVINYVNKTHNDDNNN